MQSVESKTVDPVVRRTLLATGLGAALGFQGWRLAVYGFALSIPWYGVVWVWLGHILLGVSVGMTAGASRWWKRGVGLGLAFGIASAFGGLMLGWKWVPYGIGAIVASVLAGVLIALIADAVFPVVRPAANPRTAPPKPRAGGERSKSEARARSELGQRLAKEKILLEDLDRERARRRNSAFGKASEERIVWGELLDLEIQDIDERLEQICRDADDPSKRSPRKP
jgi:hypothetical protein